MNRRTACRTTAVALLTGMAGCTGGTPPDEDPPDNDSEESPDDDTEEPSNDDTTATKSNETATNVTTMIDTDRIDDATFAQTGNCSESGAATVDFADREATISGCLTAHNGCAEPVLDSVDVEGEQFQVVIGEEDRSDADTLCTQAFVDRGYELTLRLADDRPATIEVIHDDAEGRAVVARVDRP